MFGVGHGALRLRINVEQAFHLVAVDDVLLDDLLRVCRFNLYVEGIVGDDLDDRSLLAEAETASSNHLGLLLQAGLLDR